VGSLSLTTAVAQYVRTGTTHFSSFTCNHVFKFLINPVFNDFIFFSMLFYF